MPLDQDQARGDPFELSEKDCAGLTGEEMIALVKARIAANRPPPHPSAHHADAWVPKEQDDDLGPHMLLSGAERRAYVRAGDVEGQMTLVALHAAMEFQDMPPSRLAQKMGSEAWNDAFCGGIVDG